MLKPDTFRLDCEKVTHYFCSSNMGFPMLKAFALKILILLSSGLQSPDNIDFPPDNPWKKIQTSGKYKKFYVDTWENRDLIHQCRLNPTHHIILPPIYIASQDLWSGNTLLENVGNVRNDNFEVYLSKSIPCLRIMESEKLTWKVYRLSQTFTKITQFPRVSSDHWQLSTYSSLIFFVCALIQLGIGAFALLIFKSKVNDSLLANYVIACLFTAIYGLIISASIFGLGLNSNGSFNLIALFLLSGLFFLARFLSQVNQIPNFFRHWSGLNLAALILASIYLWGDYELFTSSYYFLCYPFFITFSLFYLIKTAINFYYTKDKNNLLLFLSALLCVLFTLNDTLLALGEISSVFIAQFGFLFLFLSNILFFEKEFGLIIFQRDKFKAELENAYQEKLDYIAKNTVSHTIANTVQLIAHDIKKPFTMTKFVFNKLKSGKENYQKAIDMCSHVESSMEHVDHLLANLMTAREGYQNKLEPLDLRNIVQNAWDNSLTIEGYDFNLELNITHEIKIFADKLKVERLFINLINNAKEAMEGKGSRIWVYAELKQAHDRLYAEICLGNEGSFINEGDREQLFKQGFTKGKAEGTGLGLAICSEVVTSHGGQIRCDSDPQRGTEFIFTLPAVAPLESAQP